MGHSALRHFPTYPAVVHHSIAYTNNEKNNTGPRAADKMLFAIAHWFSIAQ